MARILTPLERQWLRHFRGVADGDPVRAAELAGAENPEVDGPLLRESLQDVLGGTGDEWRTANPIETLERLTLIVRDGRHPQQLKAIELMLKVHGMLSDKLDVTVQRADLLKQVEAEIVRLKGEGVPLLPEAGRRP